MSESDRVSPDPQVSPDRLADDRVAAIQAACGEHIQRVVADRGQITLIVKGADAREVLQTLHDDFGFDFPVDLTAVDYSEWPDEEEFGERFAVVYMLMSLSTSERIRVKALVSELEPELPTASDLFSCFDWAEREVWDMFGIKFAGHPNLIRLLCPENMRGHPLRKDYPLTGRGERDDFPVYRADQE